MTEIYNLFRGIVVLIFVGVFIWGIAQILPQAQSAATLPARVEAENELVLQQAKAAPTFIALSVLATESAIQNESLRAQAESQAQTIAAQGVADGERARGNAVQSAVMGFVGVIAFAISVFALLVVVRLAFGSRTHNAAIREVSQVGGRLEMPQGGAVMFEPRPAHMQLPAPQTESVTARGQTEALNEWYRPYNPQK